ncbi:hypothetical protein C4J95_1834 [Pseudomonas orientalis]|nr:hypothetical protein C4J96_1780 [Pseudomonas orientalis]AZE99306.1 hypothetical protein C4J95_1834 [Pseudomonas orientalis]
MSRSLLHLLTPDPLLHKLGAEQSERFFNLANGCDDRERCL